MRIETRRVAEKTEPVVADQHMTDLIAQDYIENRCRRFVARLRETLANGRRGIETARFERARHERHARQHVGAGALGHFPQAVVSGKIAVDVAELRQTRG